MCHYISCLPPTFTSFNPIEFPNNPIKKVEGVSKEGAKFNLTFYSYFAL